MENRNNGFTLVELIVSLAIVGILASLGVQLFDNYKVKVNHTIALNQVINLRTAIMTAYYDQPNFTTKSINIDHKGEASFSVGDYSSNLPGFAHMERTRISAFTYGDNHNVPSRRGTFSILAHHCEGPNWGSQNFPKWWQVTGAGIPGETLTGGGGC